MQPLTFEFKPIDIEKYQDLCIQFRADSFVCSFGSAEQFYEEDGSGVDTYLEWLKQRIIDIPNSCVHVWKKEQIVGQIEMKLWKCSHKVGYVNLFYLIPEF